VSEEAFASRPAALPHFQRAVRRERDAIKAHESAAAQQDSAAAILEARAAHESEPDRVHLLQLASEFRARAAAARERARLARERPRVEGIDLDD